jgi:hypothetical protein
MQAAAVEDVIIQMRPVVLVEMAVVVMDQIQKEQEIQEQQIEAVVLVVVPII